MEFERLPTKKDIPENEKIEWGQEIEKEIYIPFFQEILGDIFDFAVKTSKEIDGGPPKVDIIARFEKDGSHLAVQSASFELNKGGEEKLEEKKECRGVSPVWTMERISKGSGYSPKNQDEWTPKIVLNFDHWAICDSQADWARAGRKRRWFEYLKERNEKENNKYRIDILKQMIAELDDIIESDEFKRKISKNYKPKYDCRGIIRPKLEILREALKRSFNLTPK